MSSKIKILICSHSPCIATGQAEVIRLIFENLIRLYPDTYEIIQLAQFHRESLQKPQWPLIPTARNKNSEGIFQFPENDKYGQKTFSEIITKVSPDIIFAYGDPHTLVHITNYFDIKQYKLVIYLNIDGIPLPSGYEDLLLNCDYIVTSTEFVREQLLKACPKLKLLKVKSIYTPSDTNRFESSSIDNKQTLRKKYLPEEVRNKFVLFYVGRNQWRKQVWNNFHVLSFIRKYGYRQCKNCNTIIYTLNPVFSNQGKNSNKCCCNKPNLEHVKPNDDIILILHFPHLRGDWDLEKIAAFYQLEKNRDYYFLAELIGNNIVDPKTLSDSFKIADLLLFLTGGEGFGVPAWEAMAAGLPVLYTDYSAHAEFLNQANAGIPVPGELQPELDTGIFRMIAHTPSCLKQITYLYHNQAERAILGKNGICFSKKYDINNIINVWHDLFNSFDKSHSIRQNSILCHKIC